MVNKSCYIVCERSKARFRFHLSFCMARCREEVKEKCKEFQKIVTEMRREYGSED